MHKGTVGGLRWLGVGPRLVSYSSEKVTTGYRNTLMLTGAWRIPVSAAFCLLCACCHLHSTALKPLLPTICAGILLRLDNFYP